MLFTPMIWPEDPVPDYAADCVKCELSNQRTRMIWGEGNPKAKIIIILDNPGCREDKSGNAFVCGTRQTLQHAAHHTGLSFNDLYVSYVLKCKPIRKYQKETARMICLGYLQQQLQNNKFEIAFCLGDVAVQAFFSDVERNVKNTRGTWHEIEGMQTHTSYHPLAVRRRPNLYDLFIKDWEDVAYKATLLMT